MIRVSQVMTRDVHVMAPGDSMLAAARVMAAMDIGAVPVCDSDVLVGMLTDRDIVVRGVARGLQGRSTPLKELMSITLHWCFDDDSLEDATAHMRGARIRRLPVVDRDRRLVGVLALADIATVADSVDVADTVACVSQPA